MHELSKKNETRGDLIKKSITFVVNKQQNYATKDEYPRRGGTMLVVP
jgi:hypothetical protein